MSSRSGETMYKTEGKVKKAVKPRPKKTTTKGKEPASNVLSGEETEYENIIKQPKTQKKKGRPPTKRIRLESEVESDRSQPKNEDQLVQGLIEEGVTNISKPFTSNEIIVYSNQMTKKPINITGSIRKKWLDLMGDIKSWTIENKLPFAKFASFAKHYYTIVVNSDNKEETLDNMVSVFNTNRYKKTFDELIPIKVVAGEEEQQQITEPEITGPRIEDIMDEDEQPQPTQQPAKTQPQPQTQTLSQSQLKHIEEVVKIMEKDPKLKSDIKRTITEELAKGYLKPDEFIKYNTELEKLNIAQDTPITVRGTSKPPKGKTPKNTQKKKTKIITL